MARLSVIALLLSCVAHAEPAKPVDPYADPPPASKGEAKTPADKVLRKVNLFRAAAGLPAVAVDPKLSQGCMEHAQYMKLNRNTDAMAGLNAHQQRPDLPGASPAGAACGKAADLFPGVSDLEVAVDAWMAGLYHRRPILDPTLAKVGVGYAALDDGSLMAALMFVDDKRATNSWPVGYPADRQTNVPLEFGAEIPNPIPGGGRGGYPITLQFPPFDEVIDASAKLVDADGKAVPFHISDPQHPATSFGQYGVICVIPKQPLRAQTRYTVSVSATWKRVPLARSWSFTTLALRPVDATDEAAVMAAIGVPSTVRGTVNYGGMMDTATVFLQIGVRSPTRYKMLSVLIPVGIWKQIAATAGPDSFRGKTVEVQATPEYVQNTYVNLPIAAATQLSIR